jgi:lichenan operon transcriptional antiterminator
MLNRRLKTLVKELESGQFRTADFLAGRCNISEKTVRVRLNELNDLIKHHGATIVSKKGLGYQLIIVDKEEFNSYFDEREQLPNVSEDRIEYIFELLLNTNDYIKKDDLSEKLFISNKTLTAELKKIKYILIDYI